MTLYQMLRKGRWTPSKLVIGPLVQEQFRADLTLECYAAGMVGLEA